MAALDARTVTVRLAELTEHLGCVLCIYRHFLVQGSLKCPKCNITLNPRPIATLMCWVAYAVWTTRGPSRSDQKLQDVVDRIFPEYKVQDAVQEREFYAMNNFSQKDVSPRNVGKAGTSQLDHDAASRNDSVNCVRTKVKAAAKKSQTTTSVNSASCNSSANMEFTIEVHPQQMYKLLHIERVSGEFKMLQLRKLLHKRLHLSEDDQLEITCMGTTVGPELSVHFIQRTIWQLQHQKQPLVLSYRYMAP
ncbi:hypothetical protein BBJ28_00022998 [Nothophytophthora sp. Chile5]|nr:hypothetical protein BBJ28_00022998 [Nothophytophthora sp. Chile5]